MEAVNEISLDGFKVVSGDYFTTQSRTNDPTLTVWDGSIGFTKQALTLLNVCENVRMQINFTDKRILVTPTTSNDKDALRWIKRVDPLEARKISCVKLTDTLYSSWGWDKNFIYRTRGKLVTAGNKVMLLFDFNKPEHWKRPEAKNVK